MNEKLSLLAELIKISRSDHKLRKKELELIKKIALRLGISETELDRLIYSDLEAGVSLSEFDRLMKFHRLLLLMNIDEETDKQEMYMIRDLGLRMGLSPLATEKVLNEMSKYPSKIMPSDRLVEIYTAQFN